MSSPVSSLAKTAATLPRKPNPAVSHIPGENGRPVVGFTFEFLRDFPGLIDRMVAKHGPVFRYRALMQDVITITGPDANEFLLKDVDRYFSSKKAWDVILEELFPNGLMLRDFESHKVHRKILQGAFKKPVMQAYVDTMNPRFAESIARWPKGREL